MTLAASVTADNGSAATEDCSASAPSSLTSGFEIAAADIDDDNPSVMLAGKDVAAADSTLTVLLQVNGIVLLGRSGS